MSPPAPRKINPWLIAVAVTLPAFMEVLDTTIANVSLRYIAGGLAAAETDSEWVITSYLAANAFVLPISGWIGNRLGRRNYFLLSVGGFTAASALCGIAGSLPELILFRVLQGLFGGGLQPGSQGVLLDAFPPEKQGQAMTVFGVTALIAPIIGPTLGGWLTDNYSWRWVFIINLPVGLVALGACWYLLEDPPYLKERRREMRAHPQRFDTIGLGLIALGIASLEVLLSKGQEWDWLGDPFGRVQTLIICLALGLGGAVWWELRHPAPVVDLRPFRDRNFTAGGVTVLVCYAVLYGSATSLPAMLQTLFGYDATHAGLVMSPSGFFAVITMPIVGILLTRGVDARWLIAGGALVMGGGAYWMSQLNLFISPGQVVWPRVVQIIGLSMIFAPLNVAAFRYLAQSMRPAAVGVFALLRNEGGSIGTSLAKTLIDRRQQFHLQRLGENLDPLNPAAVAYQNGLRDFYYQSTGDPAASAAMAWQTIDDLRQQQALSLSYFDCFYAFAILAVLLVPLALLMRKAAAAKGEHIAAE